MPASATEQDIRAALLQHWAASDANDFPTEHQIYCDDAVPDYPQSGERVRGRANIQASRSKQPSKKRFHVRTHSWPAISWDGGVTASYFYGELAPK